MNDLENAAGAIEALQETIRAKLPAWMCPGEPTPWEEGLREVLAAMTVKCVKCKRPYVLPDGADKDRPYVCDDCWKAIMREAAEHIRIKVK